MKKEKTMIVVAKKEIKGICRKGQRMYITPFIGRNLNRLYRLHIDYNESDVYSSLSWIKKHFEIVEE